ncbi:MAG: hypothetical protein LUQ07_06835 [Methanospirillum sp.]|nr:hypothetical protein [Methanospirillum sp.]
MQTEDEIHDTLIPKVTDLLPGIVEELQRLDSVLEMVSREKIRIIPYSVLILAFLVTGAMIWYYQIMYLYYWVASSLYFYLFYPMLPVFLFPFRYVRDSWIGKKPEKKEKRSLPAWAKELHIFQNKRVGYRLFMRFFLLSMVPITSGVMVIYGISLFSSLVIKAVSNLPDQTLLLIIIQCLGIIIFYGEVFIFRGRALYLTHLIVRNKVQHRRRILFLVIIAAALIVVSSFLVILMIIAMFMPAFTLTSLVDMVSFSHAGRNISVLLVLFCQFVFMQYLQSHLSRKVTTDHIHNIVIRLKESQKNLMDTCTPEETSKASYLLTESRLYAYNRRILFGLFPSFSIGINLPVLLRIKNLKELTGVFGMDQD